YMLFFFFQAEDGIRDATVTGVQTCALPISLFEPEALRDRGAAEIDVHQEHAGIGRLREGAGEIDRGGGLAVPDGGAGDGEDREGGRAMGLLHQVSEATILLGLVRVGGHEAHETLVEGRHAVSAHWWSQEPPGESTATSVAFPLPARCDPPARRSTTRTARAAASRNRRRRSTVSRGSAMPAMPTSTGIFVKVRSSSLAWND